MVYPIVNDNFCEVERAEPFQTGGIDTELVGVGSALICFSFLVDFLSPGLFSTNTRVVDDLPQADF